MTRRDMPDDEVAHAMRTLRRFVQAGDDERARLLLMFQASVIVLLEFDSPQTILTEMVKTFQMAGVGVRFDVLTEPERIQ